MNTKAYALVTGGASGFGYYFARLLARDHYRLILVDIDEEKLYNTKEELEKEFEQEVSTITADLSQPGAASAIYKQVKIENIEILINNAGFGLSGFFKDTDWKIEETMIHLHILTSTHLTKLLLPGMLERGKGRILNISSLAAFMPGPMMAVYYASKSYLLSFGRALANELKDSGLSVTTACPGLTRTGFSAMRASLSGVAQPDLRSMADDPLKVVSIMYRDMMKGKSLSLPLVKNKIMRIITWMLPVSLVLRTIRNSQEELHKKSRVNS